MSEWAFAHPYLTFAAFAMVMILLANMFGKSAE